MSLLRPQVDQASRPRDAGSQRPHLRALPERAVDGPATEAEAVVSWRWIIFLICGIIAAVAVVDSRRLWGEWFTRGDAMLRDELMRQNEP